VTGILKSTVHEIISDLNFCKVSACWVLKMLTEEYKRKRKKYCLAWKSLQLPRWRRTVREKHCYRRRNIGLFTWLGGKMNLWPEGRGFETRWGEILNLSSCTRPWGLLSL
jgi:hypothetical protein